VVDSQPWFQTGSPTFSPGGVPRLKDVSHGLNIPTHKAQILFPDFNHHVCILTFSVVFENVDDRLWSESGDELLLEKEQEHKPDRIADGEELV
jgi:hypothetical protein